ncbi:Arfaptin-like domain-containing protein [Phlyctochytrium arcticum]|nr:Arfaptin-like domain-containing protein [Phlyctochytrium arcticum]
MGDSDISEGTAAVWDDAKPRQDETVAELIDSADEQSNEGGEVGQDTGAPVVADNASTHGIISRNSINDDVANEDEEEATLGSAPRAALKLDTDTTLPESSTEAAPNSPAPPPKDAQAEEQQQGQVETPVAEPEPEYEPEVLPVLATGLPIRLQSMMRRSPSTPMFRSSAPNSPREPPSITDISAPELRQTELPTFATASPMTIPRTPSVGDLGIGSKTAPNFVPRRTESYAASMPLSENSKSKQFNQRLDYMIGEFFTRQVTKLATSTPESMDRIHKIFTQRVREKLGQQWAHVTAQPEVDEAAKEIEAMYEYFSQLEKMVEKQRVALQHLNEAEAELSLFYQQKGYQEQEEEVGRNLVHMGMAYHQEVKERVPVISSLDGYLNFIKIFKTKAIGDSRDTIKAQKTARLEFDSYASKLGHMEEKAVKAASKPQSPTSFMTNAPLGRNGKPSDDTTRYLDKELDQTRQRFQQAKTRYQMLSTQVIDKAGLLEMKRGVDFGAHVQRVVTAFDAYQKAHDRQSERPWSKTDEHQHHDNQPSSA